MTDMVFGAAPARPGEPILPQWWRTVDRWSLAAIVGLFMAGTLLNLAASPPLAVRNGLDPFHYVWRQAAFEPRKMMNLSSSFDHRIIDGWDAAEFVQRLRALLEAPARIFMEA